MTPSASKQLITNFLSIENKTPTNHPAIPIIGCNIEAQSKESINGLKRFESKKLWTKRQEMS